MRRLLIIETDLILSMGYMRVFIVAGFDVERATSESRAIEAIGRFKPDAVLINLLFPPGNRGVKLIKWIRSEPSFRELPIVAYLREDLDDLAASAQLAGANECCVLGKTGVQDLLAAVQRLLGPPEPELPVAEEKVKSASPPSLPSALSPSSALAPPEPEPVQEIPPPKPPVQEEPASSHIQVLSKLKELSLFLFKSQNRSTRPPLIQELRRKTEVLMTEEAVRSLPALMSTAAALLALLKELAEKPDAINASSMRTINQSVNFFEELLKQPLAKSGESEHPFKVLAVDDEVIARRAVASALGLVQLTPESAKDPREGLELAKAARYDLFILDVNMPGMTGFELCEKLRHSALYKETPVIFVTANDGFDSRLRFARSGGDDFIAKPFLQTELAAKALIHLLSGRIRGLN